jgi:hypothetical protein
MVSWSRLIQLNQPDHFDGGLRRKLALKFAATSGASEPVIVVGAAR